MSELRQVAAGYAAASIPLEVLWNDIDWMDGFKNWVPDPVNYPSAEMAAFVRELHAAGQRWCAVGGEGRRQRWPFVRRSSWQPPVWRQAC